MLRETERVLTELEYNEAVKKGANSIGWEPIGSNPNTTDVPLSSEKSLFIESLIAREKEALGVFFGKDIAVPTPPKELLAIMEQAERLGWTQLEPHYLPSLDINASDARDNKRWKYKPKTLFKLATPPSDNKRSSGAPYKHIVKGNSLQSMWSLWDGSPKPDVYEGEMRYSDDFLENILLDTRIIHLNDSRQSIGRSNFSKDTLERHVLPRIRQALQVDPREGTVRLPRAIEYNVIGNIHHPEWGETKTAEWLDDVSHFAESREFTLYRPNMTFTWTTAGGRRSHFRNGLSQLSHGGIDTSRSIGFRPVVVFPVVS